MVHKPSYYAELLRRKITKYGVHCWLINTGWIGGAFGIGKRISIRYTRTLLNSALDGSLAKSKFVKDPIFGFEVPTSCEDVPADILNPAEAWPNKEAHREKYRQLASRFIENFRKFEADSPAEVLKAGPKL